MLTTQTPVPQYLVCGWLAALALGLTGSQRQQGIKFFKEEFHHGSKKETGKESRQEEKEVTMERSQVSVNQGKIVMTGVQLNTLFCCLKTPVPGPRTRLPVDAFLRAK